MSIDWYGHPKAESRRLVGTLTAVGQMSCSQILLGQMGVKAKSTVSQSSQWHQSVLFSHGRLDKIYLQPWKSNSYKVHIWLCGLALEKEGKQNLSQDWKRGEYDFLGVLSSKPDCLLSWWERRKKKGSLDKSMEPLESFLSGAGNCLKISHSNIVRTQRAHLADSLSPWKYRPPHYAQKQIDAVLHWKLPLHNQIHAFLWCRCDKQCNYRNENSWLIQAILATQEGCSCRYIHWGIFQKRLQWEMKDRFFLMWDD